MVTASRTSRNSPLTGFGIEDSHHSVSAWRRGPGWIYFQEGIFLHTQVETAHGMVRNYNGGVYQYNPRTRDLRIFASVGVGNPWGTSLPNGDSPSSWTIRAYTTSPRQQGTVVKGSDSITS